MLPKLSSDPIRLVINPIVNALKWVFDKISGMISSDINSIVNYVKEQAPITLDKAFSMLPTIIAITAGGAVGIGDLMTALNVKVMGSGLDITSLSRFFERLLSPNLVVGVIAGTILGASIRTPLRYWANAIEDKTAKAYVFESDTWNLFTQKCPSELSKLLKENNVNLIITSPPYGDSNTTVAYGQFSRYSLIWLGYKKKDVWKIDNESLGGGKRDEEIESSILNKVLKKIKNISRADEVKSFLLI